MDKLNIDWQALSGKFSEYFFELLRFNFSVINPVFWLFFLIVLLALLKFWKIGKAFSFCFVIAAILLAATKIEIFIMEYFKKNGEQFDPVLIRISCVIAVLCRYVVLFFYKGK